MESKETTTCPRCVEAAKHAEEYIRAHPAEAGIMGLSVGFILAQLPLRLLATALMRLLVMAIKPAAIFYGLYRMAEDCYARKDLQNGEK